MRLPLPQALQRRPWLLPTGGAALLLVAVASQRVGPLAPPLLAVTAPQQLRLQPDLVGTGRVEARRVHQLSSVVAARLVVLTVDTSDRVNAGQVVGQLDLVDLPDRLRSAQASLRRQHQERLAAAAQLQEAQASLRYVRSNTERFEHLAGQGAISDDALLERRQALARAEAAVQRAQALEQAAHQGEQEARGALTALSAQRRSLQLVSPASGIVTRRLVDPGSTVVPGQPVLEIADPAQFWIDVRFDQRQATGLAVNQPATVEFRRLAGRPLAGVVERIEPTADSLTEELNAKVRLQPQALAGVGFSPSLGELVEVRVALPALPDALTIPAQSLRRQQGRSGVWVAGERGLRFVPLELGRQDQAGRLEVRAGLARDARVLLNPPARPEALQRYRLEEVES